MNWVVHQTNFLSPSHLPIPLFPPPPPPPIFSSSSSSSLETNLENKISPSMLLIIVILAVIFFISGLLHLLVRFLLKPTIREPEDPDNLTAFQGQLQQLFHLHDSGVDQSFIDTLPVFHYKAIIGIKDPFDCAVCLCEFEPDDKLRLLPKCSHAFHIECIDTWLLSHSTCPLCRSSLLPEFSPNNSCSPVVLVLESGTGSERSFREAASCSSQRGEFLVDSNPHVGFLHDGDGDDDDEFGSNPTSNENSLKTGEVGGGKEDLTSSSYSSVLDGIPETRVVQVKLGKFRNAEVSESSTSNNSKLDQRRCFSMGSYEYVMNEASLLQVAIKPTKKKPRRSTKKMGSRLAMSECDFHSVREGFKGFVDSSKSSEPSARLSNTSKKESFSISKIWLRQKREKPVMSVDNSRRAFSFRLPVNDESMAKASSVSQQIESMAKVYSVSQRIGSGFEVGSEVDLDIEVGSCNNSIVSMGSQIGEAPSFARRTLMWIVGRQNKVGSHL